jgi:hypothetical protein
MSRLVEKVARAINIAQGIHGYKDDTHWREHWQWYLDGKDDPSSCVQYSTLAYGERYARAAIAAVLEDMREPSGAMLAAALPLCTANAKFSNADKELGAAACLLLSGGIHVPNEGDAVLSAAQLAKDYRAMVAAYEQENLANAVDGNEGK